MTILIKIAAWFGAVLLVVASASVIIAALYPPKEYKGDGKASNSNCWDESIEDV